MLPQTVADIQRLGDNPYVNFPEVLTHIDLLPRLPTRTSHTGSTGTTVHGMRRRVARDTRVTICLACLPERYR